MDLQLTMRVLWRFRIVVVVGFILALLLSVVSYAHLPSLKPRKPPVYAGATSLLITQRGFPLGYAVLPVSTKEVGSTPVSTSNVADPNRLASLTNTYATLASSDQLVRRAIEESHVKGKVVAAPSPAPDGTQAAMPVLVIRALAGSSKDAYKLSSTAAAVFQKYLLNAEEQAQIPQAQRISVVTLARARPIVVSGPKKTLPIAVFVAVMVVTCGLALVLENFRPAPNTEISGLERPEVSALERRTAEA